VDTEPHPAIGPRASPFWFRSQGSRLRPSGDRSAVRCPASGVPCRPAFCRPEKRGSLWGRSENPRRIKRSTIRFARQGL